MTLLFDDESEPTQEQADAEIESERDAESAWLREAESAGESELPTPQERESEAIRRELEDGRRFDEPVYLVDRWAMGLS